MKTVTMVELRRDAAGILKRVARGEKLILSHRGKPAAKLEPITPKASLSQEYPALNLEAFAVEGPGGDFSSQDVNRLLYGGE